jgi:ketosteroid isomerase-like protein
MNTNTNAAAMIIQLEQEWSAAIISNDAIAIGHFMSDDWVIIGTDGVSNKETFLDLIRSGDLTHHRMDFDPVRIRQYENVIIITSRGTSAGHYRQQPFSFYEWSTDTFTRENGQWKCILTQLVPAKM